MTVGGSRPFTVATANAASGRDRRGRIDAASWARWSDAATALDIDVLAVQEVDHRLPRSGEVDQTSVLADRLRGDGPAWSARLAAAVHGTPGSLAGVRPAAPVADDRPEEPSYGVALLSRHPVTAWRELRLGPSRVRLPVPLPPGSGRRLLWVPDEPRVALAAVVAAPDGPVSVVTTHLSFAPLRARAQLRDVARWCADLPRPLVLLGDLNLPPRLVRFPGAPALHAPTHPAHRPRVQLDHVLLDDPARRYVVGDAATYRVADSDHRAARVELVRRARAATDVMGADGGTRPLV